MDIVTGLKPWTLPLAAATAGVLGAFLLHWLLYRILFHLCSRTELHLDDRLIARSRGPARLAAAMIGLGVAAGIHPFPPPGPAIVSKVISLGWIWAAAWFCINLTFVFESALLRRYDISSADNLRARRIITQYKVFQRILYVLIVLLALAASLLAFEPVRKVGMGLLASAGIAGIVLGFSAQSTISNIFAGIQIALAQPIRLDDVVIVEGEWGRIEEIAFTYVVVRIWDQRRLVVPVRQFLERPFQNWTRTTAELLGTVTIHADYTVPVKQARAEVERICREEAGELWDGRLAMLQVTDAGPENITLRALISARDASRAWDLRCLVRERLIEWLASEHPESLPVSRRLVRGTDHDANAMKTSG